MDLTGNGRAPAEMLERTAAGGDPFEVESVTITSSEHIGHGHADIQGTGVRVVQCQHAGAAQLDSAGDEQSHVRLSRLTLAPTMAVTEIHAKAGRSTRPTLT